MTAHNFDERLPAEARLDIMEDLLAHRGVKGYASAVFEKHKIQSGHISNWGVAVKRGTLKPDPTKHPLLTAKFAKAEKYKRPKRTARSARPKPKPRFKLKLKKPTKADFERLASQPAKPGRPKGSKGKVSLDRILSSVSQVEDENQQMVAVINRIRLICDELLAKYLTP